MSFVSLTTQESPFFRLGAKFAVPVETTPLKQSYLIDVNEVMVRELGLQPADFTDENWRALVNGEVRLGDRAPFSSFYSGHQFGVWAGQLGDGRAHILGEVNGYELQLKGSGLTPFSRMGDGKAVLRSTIREYLASEAMWALGIPTTRSLAINGSGESVRRERLEPGATMIRVAPSFIRFGTFEHFKSRDDDASVASLIEYAGSRYFGLRDGTAGADKFLDVVTSRTAEMIALWMAYGFCHGVMNTDNMSVLGLTLDYGPYGFLDIFDPQHICNHSDDSGRYSYFRQPSIAHWNLLAFAYSLSSFLPFEKSQEYLKENFVRYFQTAYWKRMCSRLALPAEEESEKLVQKALEKMVGKVEYNRFFYEVSRHETDSAGDGAWINQLIASDSFWREWLSEYLRLRDRNLLNSAMKLNPRYVLKNWIAQDVIDRVELKREFSAVRETRLLFQSPYNVNASLDDYSGPTPADKKCLEVSCSS